MDFPPPETANNRLRWAFSFDNSKEAWIERGALALMLALAGLYLWKARELSFAANLACLAVWLLLFVGMVRSGTLMVFGPVLSYDFLRIGRKKFNFTLRTAYALLLGVVIAWLYFLATDRFSRNEGGVIPIKHQAEIAEGFFFTFMILQFLLLALLTPGYVAGALSEEKERKTLEFLLATDLRNSEIVFGKLASRVANLLMYVLAGLPVLGFIQFFGGIDPDMLLVCYAVTLITIVSFSCASIVASVITKRARDAIALAYLFIIAYLALSGAVQFVRATTWHDTKCPWLGITADEVADVLAWGNIVYCVAMYEIGLRITGGTNVLFDIFRQYAIAHGVFILFALGFSVWRMRSIALRQMYGRAGGPRKTFLGKTKDKKARRHPPVGDSPMIWKETYVEGGMKASGVGRIILFLIVGVSFLPAFLILFYTWDDGPRRGGVNFVEFLFSVGMWDYNRLGREMNGYVRLAGAIVTTLLFLALAVRGSNAIRGEKDKLTLDDLLTTSLSAREILMGKWIGCLRGMRLGWLWLGLMWAIGVGTQGVSFLSIPLMVLATAVFAGGFAWIGIYCSLVCGTSLRATIWSIIASLFAGGGYLLVFLFCCMMPLEMVADYRNRDIDWLIRLVTGFSPSWVVGYLPFREWTDGEMKFDHTFDDSFLPFALIGVLGWGIFSYAVGSRCLHMFREQSNRLPYSPPSPEIVDAELLKRAALRTEIKPPS